MDRIAVVHLDFDGTDPTPEAVSEVDGVFLMRPPQIADVAKKMFPFLRGVREHGEPRIIFLSLLGAQYLPFVPHRKLEKEIGRLGLEHVFIRAGFFMQNLSDLFREFIRDQGIIPAPAGRSSTSFVDARDLGEATARLLEAEELAYPTVELTGVQRLTYHDVAERMSRELGREILYPGLSTKAFKNRALQAGWDADYVTVVARLFLTVRLGMASKRTEELRNILDRPPRTMEEYLRDYREVWERE